ncbi:prephenate dehydratase [Taylorella equigenitalis]|uniref:prephenate dehydratase n=1 Tax=Taylorella equigenitalis TaxID=29575 RepID=UPI00237C8884|nr:prephenate dehydratase [Taylorella equigenitalis]WDU55354.1 prephenate dehydratase [Taylorella equigenitalis]
MADQNELLSKLAPLRDQIDEIDDAILNLLDKRARLAVEVGEIKKKYGSDSDVLKPERETIIFKSLSQKAEVFPSEAVQNVWTEIISACRGLERKLKVAYLGPSGSFSEIAAYKIYGHYIDTISCVTFEEVFKSVESKVADVGVVPVENSTEGTVNTTQDLFLGSKLKIHSECDVEVHHCLLHKTGDISNAKKLFVHPQTRGQCHKWISNNLPTIEIVTARSNSEAAHMASTDSASLAIASESASIIYDLKCIHHGVQDSSNNKTRFVGIGYINPKPSGNDKTSLIFAASNEAGSVYKLLNPFAEFGVSMSRLESRPFKNGEWEYYFYVDLLGHAEDQNVKKALNVLKSEAPFVKVLGSYPATRS